jgi:hypothetical protein
MNDQPSRTQFVVCVNNEGYAASLETRKIYQALPDDRAQEHALIRVIDESGEDYLYPADYFAAIDPPPIIEKAFALAD